jgi:hypothetical protein|nr:MAG TPA_asm: hypothetical protein [Caudoviricetes sp.]
MAYFPEADKRYKKTNVSRVLISLYANTDKDIIALIDEMNQKKQSKQAYIKRLIREDMARRAKEEPGE